MLTRARVTLTLLIILSCASIAYAVWLLHDVPGASFANALMPALVVGSLLALHLRGWRWSSEALVAGMTALVIVSVEPEYLRVSPTMTALIPTVLAAALLSPRWTIAVFGITMLGFATHLWLVAPAGAAVALGPTFSSINLLILALITSGIAVSSAVARAAQAAAEAQALQAREAARRADEALALLNTVIHSASVGFAFVDRELRYQLINPQLAAITDPSQAVQLGSRARELFPTLADSIEPLLKQVLATGQPVLDVELAGSTPAARAQLRHWLCSYYPVRTRAGELLGVGTVMLDISERMRTEQSLRESVAERAQAEQKLIAERALLARRVDERTADLSAANAELARAAQMKDAFLASMSHELRTPLNTVLGLSGALREQHYGVLNEAQDHALHTIEDNGKQLLALINDILDLAKIGAGKLALALAPTSVELVCQASLRSIGQAAQTKQITIHQAPVPAELTVQADARRLTQILVNLLANAVKFTPPGGSIGLEVTTDAQHGALRFTVWDTGIGIAPDQLAHLFQPFVQLDSRLARQYEGTGLGLALVLRMTELHGGSVAVSSEVGVGSRFTVALPWAAAMPESLARDVAAAEPLSATSAAPTANDAAPLPIVLADDNEDNIALMVGYLSNAGYRVVVARNGEETIARAREAHPALILMDVHMPGMDGLEATRRIHTDPQLAEIPILALAAMVMPGDRERYLAAGVNAYLSKPIGMDALAAMIARYLVPQTA
jgi:signal transduction histidine kinase/ActR/RegA family two-component response regulator